MVCIFLEARNWGLQAIVLETSSEFKVLVLLIYVDNEEPEEKQGNEMGKMRSDDIKHMEDQSLILNI